MGMFDGAAVEQRRRALRYHKSPQSCLLSPVSRSRASCASDHQGAHLGGVGLLCCAAKTAGDPTACVRLAFEACLIGPQGGSLGG